MLRNPTTRNQSHPPLGGVRIEAKPAVAWLPGYWENAVGAPAVGQLELLKTQHSGAHAGQLEAEVQRLQEASKHPLTKFLNIFGRYLAFWGALTLSVAFLLLYKHYGGWPTYAAAEDPAAAAVVIPPQSFEERWKEVA